jgi:hypothetical protein
MQENIKLSEEANQILEKFLSQNPKEIKKDLMNLLTAISAFIEDTTNLNLYLLLTIYDLFDSIDIEQTNNLIYELNEKRFDNDYLQGVLKSKSEQIVALIDTNKLKDEMIKKFKLKK